MSKNKEKTAKAKTVRKERPIRFGKGIPAIDLNAIDWYGGLRTQEASEGTIALAQQLFPKPSRRDSRLSDFNQCGEVRFSRLLSGLKTASDATLDAVQRHLDAVLDEARRIEAPKSKIPVFVIPALRQDARAAESAPALPEDLDVIAEAIRRVGDVTGWSPKRSDLVAFAPLERRVRGMTTPAGQVLINEQAWREGTRDFRLALVAHEFFHHAQYENGFRSQPLEAPYAWFSEGTAAWMEYTAGKKPARTLTTKQKALATSSHPAIGLLNSSYYGFPFWLELTEKWGPDMREVLRRLSTSPRLSKLRADVQAICESSLRRRIKGTAIPAPGVHGPDGAMLTPVVASKAIAVGGSPVKTCGCVARYASEIFDVSSQGSNVWFQVCGEVLVSTFRDNKFEKVDCGAVVSMQTPFRLIVTGKGSSKDATCLYNLVSGSDAPPATAILEQTASRTVAMDSLGNILITQNSAKSAISYQVDNYAAAGSDDPGNPGEFAGWFTGAVAGGSGNATATVKLTPGFVGRFTQIQRSASISGNDITITTVITPSGSEIPGYESIAISAASGDTANSQLDHDGDAPATCTGDDCDAESRPVWFRGFQPGDRDAQDPIVPFPCKAFLPAPPDLAGTTIKEVYRIPS